VCKFVCEVHGDVLYLGLCQLELLEIILLHLEHAKTTA
jgi:hypothetical protein